MKKLLLLLAGVVLVLAVGCGGEKKDTETSESTSNSSIIAEGPLARIFHEKEMANPFQAYKIRLNANSKKGIRRDRLYTHPTRFPRFQTS